MPIRALKIAEISIVTCLLCAFLAGGAPTALGAGPKGKKPAVQKQAASSGTQPRTREETAGSVEPAPIREWGPYLDAACELTYWDKSEIREWREKQEKEIGVTLADFISEWSAKSAERPEDDQVDQEGGAQLLFQERDYLRLAVAHTIDYLQSDNRDSLNGASKVLLKLKNKESMPVIAFWTGFVDALQAIEHNDPPQFVARVYDIWNNSVMYMEQGAATDKESPSAVGNSPPFYYRNIVHLVVTRAVIDRKMGDVNALGPLFLMLNQRDLAEKAEGNYLTTLVRRIADNLVAPDSDRFRLNFAVAIIEARRLQQITAAKFDSEGMSGDARKSFEQSRLFNDLAFKWAASPRSSGAVSAVSGHLDITSMAIERLNGNEKAPEYDFFAMLPAHDGMSTLFNAMAVYNDIATGTEGGWSKAGYANRDLYLKATHRLWRAIMEFSLWTGDYYLMKLSDSTGQRDIFSLATPMQTVLNTYLDFLDSQKRRGFPGVIPDSAYFGAAEAAEKLAWCYLKTCPYSTDSTPYNLWFVRRLQATEIFPLDPRGIARTASILKRDGRYNLFLDYFMPLAGRLRQSGAVQNWLKNQSTEQSQAIRNYIGSVDAIFTTASEGRSSEKAAGKTAPAYAAPLRQLREELQRNPDHPVHKLLRDFYEEEMGKKTAYTLLLQDPDRLNRGF